MILNSFRWRVGALTLVTALLAACSSGPRTQAPVEDRTSIKSPQAAPAPVATVATAKVEVEKVMPGAENAGKPGYYTVRQGDTLTRIGLDHGHAWRDLAKWNNLDNPNLIETGQVIRVAPPGAVIETAGVVVRPVTNAGAPNAKASAISPPPETVGKMDPKADAKVDPKADSKNSVPAAPSEELAFIWPANGPLLNGFDEAKNKGLDIGGKAGDPVMAAADGQVVYAGSGLRGYGNLLILKHNSTFLTAYAHNQSLLVKEDQKVKKGQKIAEMGNSDSNSGVKLHFEIRRQGKPIDPAKLLPAR
jgi:lipoprotein NlpD